MIVKYILRDVMYPKKMIKLYERKEKIEPDEEGVTER